MNEVENASEAHKANEDTLHLAEKLGEFIKYWGFKKVHGQIWCLVYLSEKPVESSYLLNSLNISKALLCLSTKDLESYNVIHKVPGSNKKSIYYKANTELIEVILEVLKQREHKLLEQVQVALKSKTIQDSEHVSPKRLGELHEMTDLAQTSLKKITELKDIDMSLWKMLMQ